MACRLSIYVGAVLVSLTVVASTDAGSEKSWKLVGTRVFSCNMPLLRSLRRSSALRLLGILWRREIDKITGEKSDKSGFTVVEGSFQPIDGNESGTLRVLCRLSG